MASLFLREATAKWAELNRAEKAVEIAEEELSIAVQNLSQDELAKYWELTK